MQATPTPFRPIYGTTIQCPATSTSARVAIPAEGLKASSVRVVHAVGTGDVRFRSGSSTVTAVTLTDPLVRAGSQPSTMGINAGDTHIAVITDTGTGTLEFTFGTGSV